MQFGFTINLNFEAYYDQNHHFWEKLAYYNSFPNIKESFLTIFWTQNFFKIKPVGLSKQQLHKLVKKCGKLIILTKIRVEIVFFLAK